MSEKISHSQTETRKRRSLKKVGAFVSLVATLATPAVAQARSESDAGKPSPKQPGIEHPLKAPDIAKLISQMEIKGDRNCKIETRTALKLLAHHTPYYFNRVVKYIGVIDCESGGSGMYAYENPPRFVVGDKQREAGIYWYTSVLVHDATHSMLYHQYLARHPGVRVPDNAWIGRKAEDISNNAQAYVLQNIGAPEYYENYYLDYLNKIRSLPYWDVPVGERP